MWPVVLALEVEAVWLGSSLVGWYEYVRGHGLCFRVVGSWVVWRYSDAIDAFFVSL